MLSLTTRAQSRELLQAQIKAYLETLPDSERFKDYFEAGTGKTIIDLLTGISELLIYKLEVRSLDSYLFTSISKSATYLLSQMVGYNPNRKSHSFGKVRITFLDPTTTNLSLPFGFLFDNLPVVLTTSSNYIIPAGTTTFDVDVVQGTWIDLTYSSALNSLTGTNWEALVVEEQDFMVDQSLVFVDDDGVQLSTVNRIEQATSSSVIIKTDYKGGVMLLFGDGVYGYKLSNSSIINVRYLQTLGLSGILSQNTDLGEFVLSNNIFTATTLTAVQGGSNEDSTDKVKYLASRFFQTQGRAVTKYDHEAMTMSYPGVVSAKAIKSDSCCTITISALKDNYLSWSQLEIDDYLAYMDKYKMLSSLIVFRQPEAVSFNLSVIVVVPPSLSSANLQSSVLSIITSKYCYKLGNTYYPTKLVDEIKQLNSLIKRVYLSNTTLTLADDYTDMPLQFYQYFSPGTINVTKQIEYDTGYGD